MAHLLLKECDSQIGSEKDDDCLLSALKQIDLAHALLLGRVRPATKRVEKKGKGEKATNKVTESSSRPSWATLNSLRVLTVECLNPASLRIGIEGCRREHPSFTMLL